MDALVTLALTIAPELARWLSGETAEATISAVKQTFLTVTGTTDPTVAAAALQREPAVTGQLRILLARLAADCERLDRGTALAAVADAVTARYPGPTTSPQKSAMAWSAPIVSTIVLITFAAVVTLVLTCGVPRGSETMANMLLGTLAAMATSVVSYWVGSSAGSARKEEQIAQASRAASPN